MTLFTYLLVPISEPIKNPLLEIQIDTPITGSLNESSTQRVRTVLVHLCYRCCGAVIGVDGLAQDVDKRK